MQMYARRTYVGKKPRLKPLSTPVQGLLVCVGVARARENGRARVCARCDTHFPRGDDEAVQGFSEFLRAF